MTDNEIIKALEWMRDCKCEKISNCDGCPLHKHYPYCDEISAEIALDLIKRKDADLKQKDTEIDILIRKNETLKDEVAELRAEVERLQGEIKKLRLEMSYMSSPNTIGDRHEMGCW